MRNQKNVWFKANKDNVGWYPVSRKGKISQTITPMLILIGIIGVISGSIKFWLVYFIIVVGADVVLIKLTAEPNPRNQIFRNYLKYRKNLKK